MRIDADRWRHTKRLFWFWNWFIPDCFPRQRNRIKYLYPNILRLFYPKIWFESKALVFCMENIIRLPLIYIIRPLLALFICRTIIIMLMYEYWSDWYLCDVFLIDSCFHTLQRLFMRQWVYVSGILLHIRRIVSKSPPKMGPYKVSQACPTG